MLKASQKQDAPMFSQVAFWNRWNAEARESSTGDISKEQAAVITSWLGGLGRTDLDIIDVGCGAGWLCPQLVRFGRVTGTDLSDSVLARAANRFPDVNFVAGDFMGLDFGRGAFDVVVSLEVLSHVADQPAFLRKLAGLLRPGGYLMLATQNRPQLERNNLPAPVEGQIRRWVDRDELVELVEEEFEIDQLFSITPICNRGVLRVANSRKFNTTLSAVGLGSVSRWAKKAQEKAWLGWTLMTLARKRATGAR
jgi:2-polyprenyl-3-methyl-5-hydroxy-6-metoxy-1,4-benzoquinol methylase